jgi:integrase
MADYRKRDSGVHPKGKGNRVSTRVRKTIRIGGKQIRRYFRTKELADKWYRKMQDQRDLASAGIEPDDEDILLVTYAKKFIARRSKLYPHNTWQSDEQRMRTYILPAFGQRTLASVTRQEWANLLEAILVDQGKSKGTVNHVRALASKMYNDALSENPPLARENPVTRIKPHKTKLERLKKMKSNFFKSREEILAYLKTAYERDPAFFVYSMIGLNCGLRDSQKIGLQWRDVDWVQRLFQVERSYQRSNDAIKEGSKGFDAGEDYVVGINDTLFKTLKWWQGATPFRKPTDWICATDDGDHFYSWHIRKRHNFVIKAAELPRITPHGIRHSYATHYLEAGGRLEDLQKMLGHKDLSTSQIYTHVIPKTMKDKANVLSLGGLNNQLHPLCTHEEENKKAPSGDEA